MPESRQGLVDAAVDVAQSRLAFITWADVSHSFEKPDILCVPVTRIDSILKQFRDLDVWRGGEERALHKPLLVLLALGRLHPALRGCCHSAKSRFR
jgi:hypothetical protein